MDKFELHPELHDASLEKACQLAAQLVNSFDAWHNSMPIDRGQVAYDLSYLLEYLRLNFDLVQK